MSADVANTILHSTVPVDDRVGERDLIMVQRSSFVPVFEVDTNASFKINGPLPSKGDQYIAVVFVGYGSIMNQLSKVLPGVKIVTFDILAKPTCLPTIQGDYLLFDWEAFIKIHGAPIAVIMMPPCGPRSRQHPIGTHYDAQHNPVSIDAVRADNLVDKSLYDISVIKKHNPQVQWGMENPHYSKFTGLLSVQPYITSGKYAVIQYKDYDVAFSVKRTIIVHKLLHWKPRPMSNRRNHPGVKWNSVNWNEQKRWAWPEQLSREVALAIRTHMRSTIVGPLATAMTRSMIDAAKALSAKAASIAMEALKDAIMSANKAQKVSLSEENADRRQANDECKSLDAEESSASLDKSRATGSNQTPCDVDSDLLSDCAVREVQRNDENIQLWIKVAELKDVMVTKQIEYERDVLFDESPAFKPVRDAQSAHHNALMALPKGVRGFVDHMFVNEVNVLVIANANREDPIPVINRTLGMSMIIRSHDQISTLHLGARKMYNWLIERCWWYGMNVDIQKHTKSCLTCHRMKFSASPGYGYQQMRWWNGPGKIICIDLVVLNQSHKSSQGTMYIFTILDCFSHYPDAYPLQTATAKDFAECIFKWCSSNGVPQEIRSDGGSNLNQG